MNKNRELELLRYIDTLKKENKQLKRSKKYGLVWEDTEEELDTKPVIPMIKKEELMNVGNIEKVPRNYLIEGDNYHALKVLQHTHKGNIDVIYIDPPYNTGNEFVYNDKIVDKEDNFRHSKWLSFMDKRLRLAKNLMKDDGVIFISIDDNEQAQLKLLMDEIFGGHNFIANILWQKTKKPSGNTNLTKRTIDRQHEYILIYSLNKSLVNFEMEYASDEELKRKGYILKDEYYEERGLYKLVPLWHSNSGSSFKYVPSLDYPLRAPNGDIVTIWRNEELSPERKMCYTWSKDTFDIGNSLGFIEFKQDNQGRWSVYRKIYSKVKFVPQQRKILPIRNGNPYTDYYDGSTTDTSAQLIKNIGLDFNFTKPIELLKHLITITGKVNGTYLDFFAGSGTTGHAVMELNNEDGGNRTFILCTNNEVSEEKIRQHFVDKGLLTKNTKSAFNKFKGDNPELVEEFYQSDDYKQLGISRSVTRERIKRVSEGYTTPKGDKVEGLGGNLEYYVTEEFSEEDVYSDNRNHLAELALNSHSIKYPTNIYQNILVNTLTNLDEITIDSNKKPTFLINAKDNATLYQLMSEITFKFGTNTIVHSIEDYYENI